MEHTQLDSLMKIAKKGDASKEKKEQFNELIKTGIAENGYSEQIEKYLYDGFSFCGAKPVSEHIIALSSADERSAFFKSICEGKLFYLNDKGITFKYMISLFGNLIADGLDDPYLLGAVIGKIPGLAFNKENKRWGDISKTVEKYFLATLTVKSKFPSIENLAIKRSLFDKFSQMIVQSVSGDCINKKYLPVIDKILNWFTVDIPKPVLQELQDAGKTTAAVTVVAKTAKNKVEELKAIADYLAETERKCKTLDSECERLKAEISSLEQKSKKLGADLEREKATSAELTEKKETYYSQTLSLKSELADTNKKIDNLTKELEKHNTVLSVFESDKQNSQQEQLNSIASKLRSEYKDFTDALGMEMTVDLGENMRQQLVAVFKILSKNGIDIEGRL